MGISFAITAYNEHEELDRLLNQIIKIVKPEDEIVIQLDSKATIEVISLVDEFLVKNKKEYNIKRCIFNLNKDLISSSVSL